MLRLYLVLFLILTLMRNQCNCEALELCLKNACFTFVNETKLSWSKARKWCVDRGADLASIRNEEEQSFIKKNLPDKNGQEFWIGLNDTNKENDFQWVDGTPFHFKFWLSEEPGGGKDENCVDLYIDKKNTEAQWSDRSCRADQYFLCRKTKKNTSTHSSQSTAVWTTPATAATARPQLVWISLFSLFIIALS